MDNEKTDLTTDLTPKTKDEDQLSHTKPSFFKKIAQSFQDFSPKRQMYILLGLIFLFSPLIGEMGHLITFILGLFFLISGLSNVCYLEKAIAKCPWNKK